MDTHPHLSKNTHRMTRFTKGMLIGLCIVSFLLLFIASFRTSLVVDELAHIPSGYAYDHFLDYRLNPEHPPVLKALAALPLQFMHLQFPTTNQFWTSAVNGEWGVGGAFLFGGVNNPYLVIEAARIFPILFTIGLILLTYFWARRLYDGGGKRRGEHWALVPAIMVGLSPIFLGQGNLVTTDLAAAFGTVLGLWTFEMYVNKPTRRNLVIAGVCFGLAELMKFSTLLLIPIYAVLLIIHFIAQAHRERRGVGTLFLRHLGMYFAIMGIGLLVLYLTYALFTAGYPITRQVSDTQATIGYLAGQSCSTSHWIACFAKLDIWGAGHALTRPLAECLLGVLMVIKRLDGTNISYFLGQVSDQGSPWYFPVVYALKETIPALAMIVVGLALGAGRFFKGLFRRPSKFFDYALDRFAELSMIVFVIAYWTVSIRSPLNIGVRHLLPTIPLIYILAIGAIARVTNLRRYAVFITAMLIWLAGETAFSYPYYLSYFNEFAGGTWNGYHYVTDSNYDWGQDMYALTSFMDTHPEVSKIALDFFGGSNPQYYLGDKYAAWNSSMGDPADQGIQWFAVSINDLQDAVQPAAPDYHRAPDDGYQWLLATHPKEPGLGGVPAPDYRIGTTIFIYKLK